MSRSSSAQAKWRQIVQEHRSSGLAVSAFCRQRAVPVSSFFAWKRRLARQRREALPPFVSVKAVNDSSGGHGSNTGSSIEQSTASLIELCLGQDRRLVIRRGFDHQLLLEVVAALEGLS